MPLVLKKNLSKFSTWDSLNNSDVTIATTLGTSQEAKAKEFFPKSKLVSIESPARDFQEVLAGRADVFITSNIEGATLQEKFGVVRVKNAEARSPTPIAMLLPQTDQVWINYINNWVKVKEAKGFFAANKKKYGL